MSTTVILVLIFGVVGVVCQFVSLARGNKMGWKGMAVAFYAAAIIMAGFINGDTAFAVILFVISAITLTAQGGRAALGYE